MDRTDVGIIVEVMRNDDMEGYIDPATSELFIGGIGEVFGSDGEVLEDIPETWKAIPEEDSSCDYRDMEDFTSMIADSALQERLRLALEMQRPFHNFRIAIHDAGRETAAVWGRYRDARRELRAVRWLRDEELVAPRMLKRIELAILADLESAEQQVSDRQGMRERESEGHESETVSLRVSVRGRVQGVGFRWFTRDAADAVGVTGWVRNRHDGSVEALLHGGTAAVESVIDAMREGPLHSDVREIATMPAPESSITATTGFEIRSTS